MEGVRLCEEALRSDWQLQSLYVTKSFRNHPDSAALFGLARERHLSPVWLAEQEIRKITATRNTQGVALLVDIPEPQPLASDPEWMSSVVLLDSVSDPGNLGTIMRSAAWFGVRHLACGPGTVEWTNPKVMRASMGAVFQLSVHEISNWDMQITQLKISGYSVIAADTQGMPLRKFTHSSHPLWALILGNEAHGVSTSVGKLADITISIPGEGPVDSLNVAMAGTILLYELTHL